MKRKAKFRKGQVVVIYDEHVRGLLESYGKVKRIHFVKGKQDLVPHPTPYVGKANLDVHGFWYDAPSAEPWNWCHGSRLRPLNKRERGRGKCWRASCQMTNSRSC